MLIRIHKDIKKHIFHEKEKGIETQHPEALHSQQYNFSYDLLLSSCPAIVHSSDPFKLIAGFEVFGNAYGFGELGSDKVNLLIGLQVDLDKMLHQGVLHQHQRKGVGLMFLQILLPHSSEAADIPGRLRRERQGGIVIVAAFCVSDVHVCILL